MSFVTLNIITIYWKQFKFTTKNNGLKMWCIYKILNIKINELQIHT